MRKTFFCIDAHTCGNPVRLVAGGGPQLSGNSMMERRLHFLAEYDWIRKGLMFEPRGHDMMSGSILYPPRRPSQRHRRSVYRNEWMLTHVRPWHHRHSYHRH
ncbi:MAG TPA: proline racemase family protein [Parapedobacter sp.]|uniref:proline racemase family protein n=1 Tax=Parapedobacter sp. TaxID=1958893 RepID=UPI002CFEE5DC|nr:proline racemase family protein [Parapedobacter sp.]HWK56038.1 proline racemase family protein [Parapedobacter sp.]